MPMTNFTATLASGHSLQLFNVTSHCPTGTSRERAVATCVHISKATGIAKFSFLLLDLSVVQILWMSDLLLDQCHENLLGIVFSQFPTDCGGVIEVLKSLFK